MTGGGRTAEIVRFSPKQKKVLTWWRRQRWEAIICDGAVRSGKTFSMGLSFFLWAQSCFDGRQFGLCGKTISSLRRNLLQELVPYLQTAGDDGAGSAVGEPPDREYRGAGEPLPHLRRTGRVQRVADPGQYPGGRAAGRGGADAPELCGAGLRPVQCARQPAVVQLQSGGAAALVLPGVDPEGGAETGSVPPLHHGGQPGASRPVSGLATGGLTPGCFTGGSCWGSGPPPRAWCTTSSTADQLPAARRRGPSSAWRISVDYGTANPASFGLWGRKDGVWYRTAEYYYDSRRTGRQKTDGEYVEDLRRLAGGRTVQRVIADPSAASFILALRRAGFRVEKARNDVADGIRVTADLLKAGRLVICEGCADLLREMELYCWDERGTGTSPGRSTTTPWMSCGISPWTWRRRNRGALRRPAWSGGPCEKAPRRGERGMGGIGRLKWFQKRKEPAAAAVQLRETGAASLRGAGRATPPCAPGRSGCTGPSGRRCRWWTPPSTS